MLTRRTLLAASAATPFVSYSALAQTPRDLIVMGKQIDDIITLDPHESFEYTGNEVDGNCYQKLVNPDPLDPGTIKGELAERWDVSEGGLTYTFHMRDGVKFASGAPVTAEDAAFSLMRAVALNKAPAFIINQFGFSKDNAAQTIRATDARTLVLKIAEKQAPTFLFYCLSANVAGIVEKAACMAHDVGGDLGNAWLKTTSAGSGAWVARSWKASESVILDANPNAAVAPKARRLVIRHVADPSAQLLLLQKGDIDIARNLLSDQIIAASKDPAFTLTKSSKSSIMYLALNQKNPILAKPQVRQAFKWAIDYDAIEKNITPDKWSVHQSFLPTGFPAALEDKPFHKDTAKARALLAEAGVAPGTEITLDHASVAPNADIAQAIQADLGQAGIKLTLLAGEQRQVITKTRARSHEVAMVAWGSDYFDPHSNAETFNINTDNTDGAKNRTLAWRSDWQDKDLSDRAIANVKETDGAKRIAVYKQMQRDAQARSPFVLLLQETEVAVQRKGVTGFEIGPMSDRTNYARIVKA